MARPTKEATGKVVQERLKHVYTAINRVVTARQELATAEAELETLLGADTTKKDFVKRARPATKLDGTPRRKPGPRPKTAEVSQSEWLATKNAENAASTIPPPGMIIRRRRKPVNGHAEVPTS